MGAINDAFNKAGLSILSLASAVAKYRAMRNAEGKNRAKQSYNTAATIKKQNDELTNYQLEDQVETPKPYFDLFNSPLPPEIDEQKIAEQKVSEGMTQEKAKVAGFGELVHAEDVPAPNQAKVERFDELAGVEEAPAPNQAEVSSFDELPTVSAERSETNIDANDPEVQGLIEVKQKNALRAVAGQRSQKRYQAIKATLTGIFADEHYIEDVWRNISLAPDITDQMIRKAGLTKTQILEEWKNYKDSPSDWYERQNNRGDEYGVVGSASDDYEEGENFGRLMSAYIRAKAGGKTLNQQVEEHELSKFSPEEEAEFEENYKVWQDDSTDDLTEEEKDKEKKDKGIIF